MSRIPLILIKPYECLIWNNRREFYSQRRETDKQTWRVTCPIIWCIPSPKGNSQVPFLVIVCPFIEYSLNLVWFFRQLESHVNFRYFLCLAVFVSSFGFSAVVLSILEHSNKFTLSNRCGTIHFLPASFWPSFNCTENCHSLVKRKTEVSLHFFFYLSIIVGSFTIYSNLYWDIYLCLLSQVWFLGSDVVWLQTISNRKEFSAHLSHGARFSLHLSFFCRNYLVWVLRMQANIYTVKSAAEKVDRQVEVEFWEDKQK